MFPPYPLKSTNLIAKPKFSKKWGRQQGFGHQFFMFVPFSVSETLGLFHWRFSNFVIVLNNVG
jgi:hypothetical protein